MRDENIFMKMFRTLGGECFVVFYGFLGTNNINWIERACNDISRCVWVASSEQIVFFLSFERTNDFLQKFPSESIHKQRYVILIHCNVFWNIWHNQQRNPRYLKIKNEIHWISMTCYCSNINQLSIPGPILREKSQEPTFEIIFHQIIRKSIHWKSF